MWVIVYAAWINISTQSSGTTITHTLWNELKNKRILYEQKVDILVPPGVTIRHSILVLRPTEMDSSWWNKWDSRLWRGEFIRWLDNGRCEEIFLYINISQNKLATSFFNEVDDALTAGRYDMFDGVGVNYDGSVELAVTRASYPSLTPVWNVSNSKSYGINRVRPQNVAFLYCIANKKSSNTRGFFYNDFSLISDVSLYTNSSIFIIACSLLLTFFYWNCFII